MRRHPSSRGFTLTELLLVLAIIGIVTVIAVPALTGERRRARRIGDAETNARILSMALEGRKAENGIYGPANSVAVWSPGNATPTLTGFTSNPAPGFSPGNSTMAFRLTVVTPLTYTVEVIEGGLGGSPVITVDQTGSKTVHQK